MALELYSFMRERYNAHVVPLLTERAIPGFLFHVRWLWAVPVDTRPVFLSEDGYAAEFLGKKPQDYPSSIVNANIVQESVDDQQKLGGSISLPQYGLSFSADLDAKFKVDIAITGIRARVFDRSPDIVALMEALLALPKSKPYWKWVNDDFLVTESFYVSSFTAKFTGSGGVSAKAAFQKAGLKTEAGVNYTWNTNSQLSVVGTPNVPLAVRGQRV